MTCRWCQAGIPAPFGAVESLRDPWTGEDTRAAWCSAVCFVDESRAARNYLEAVKDHEARFE